MKKRRAMGEAATGEQFKGVARKAIKMHLGGRHKSGSFLKGSEVRAIGAETIYYIHR